MACQRRKKEKEKEVKEKRGKLFASRGGEGLEKSLRHNDDDEDGWVVAGAGKNRMQCG